MTIQIRKGQRKQLRLRLLIDGPAKSGKSYTALRFAFALAPTRRVCVIEAGELGSTEKYIGEEADGHRWEFDITQLENYSPESYTEAVLELGRQGYEAIVIDSLSAEWTGKGGALEIADKGSGPFGGWKTATPLHDKMFETILASPCHVVATVRSKMDYVIEANEKGKMEPRKVGLAPIQRDTAPYEFDILLSMDAAHVGTVSGSRCRAIDGVSVLKPGADFLKPVMLWLDTGVQADPPKPSPRITDPQVARVAELLTELRWTADRITRDFPKKYGVTELTRLNHEQAAGVIKWLEAQAGAAAKRAEQQAPAQQPAGQAASASAPTPTANGHAAKGPTQHQLEQLGHLRTEVFKRMGINPDDRTTVTAAWLPILAKRGVKSAKELTPTQAEELIGNLKAKAESLAAARELTPEEKELEAAFRPDGQAGVPPAP